MEAVMITKAKKVPEAQTTVEREVLPKTGRTGKDMGAFGRKPRTSTMYRKAGRQSGR